MSTKEVRRWTINGSLHHEVIKGPETFGEIKVMPVADHLAAMAEKDAEIDRLKQVRRRQTSMLFRQLIKEREEAREMIEKRDGAIKKLRLNVAHDEECASFDDHACDCWRGPFLSKIDAELEQKAEAKDE